MFAWIIRPIVIMIAGTAGLAAIKESPLFGTVFVIIAFVVLLNTCSG